ncbi:MAG: PstS family phosphate ABC transporter substrate-binding protein [Synechocystis sp.]
MTVKNETMLLLAAAVITSGLFGGGAWWLSQQFAGAPTGRSSQSPQDTGGTGVNVAAQVETLAEVAGVPVGTFRYGGSTTFAPIRAIADPHIATVWPKFQLVYVDPITGTPGSGKGIEMLLANQLTFSQSSRSLKPKEQDAAQAKGFSLQEVPVAIDGIAIAVNPTLTVPGITIAQLRDIYTGKITNWQQVGGPDLSITPYSRDPKDGGTVEFFIEQVLENEPLGNTVEIVHSTTPGLQKVSQNPGGIYYASAPELVPQCTVKPLPLGRVTGEWVAPYQAPLVPPEDCPQQRNRLNISAFQQATYPITRNIFVIVKQDGRQDEQAGIAYANLLLSQQGQQLIEEAGFVALGASR